MVGGTTLATYIVKQTLRSGAEVRDSGTRNIAVGGTTLATALVGPWR